MKHKKYTNTTRKTEFIKEKIKELHEDDIFLSLDKKHQQEIINCIIRTKEKSDLKYNISQVLIYGTFLFLIIGIITNVFIDYIHIPVNIYLVFFSFTLGTMLLIYADQKKNMLKKVSLILKNWDEIPEETLDDFILVIKQQIESSTNSPLGKLFFSEYLIYSVYVILAFLFIKVFIEDRGNSLRLFTILYLDLLVIFFFQNPIYVFDNLYLTDSNHKKDLLELYERRITENYKKSVFITICFFVITFSFILLNFEQFISYF